jgi:two-component system, OmpR family, phosphate regulon response regulator PhoB
MRPLILIHSQDPEFYLLFSHILNADGFASALSGSTEEALGFAIKRKPEAIILDCHKDDDEAPRLCTKLKEKGDTREIPVVALIGAEAESRHLDLLKAGIDESFTRPFAPVKLLAWLRTALAVPDTAYNENGELRHGAISLNQQTHRVHCNGREIHLPPIEFRLLQHLLLAPGRVWSREELMKAAWRQDASADLRSVDTHIARLRKSLKAVLGMDVIRTVRSAGYSLEDAGPRAPDIGEPAA